MRGDPVSRCGTCRLRKTARSIGWGVSGYEWDSVSCPNISGMKTLKKTSFCSPFIFLVLVRRFGKTLRWLGREAGESAAFRSVFGGLYSTIVRLYTYTQPYTECVYILTLRKPGRGQLWFVQKSQQLDLFLISCSYKPIKQGPAVLSDFFLFLCCCSWPTTAYCSLLLFHLNGLLNNLCMRDVWVEAVSK